jgi:hypothetical protein
MPMGNSDVTKEFEDTYNGGKNRWVINASFIAVLDDAIHSLAQILASGIN